MHICRALKMRILLSSHHLFIYFFQVTAQRYILVTKPHSAKKFTSTKAVSKWVMLVVILTIIYSLPFFFKYEAFYVKSDNFHYYRRAEWSKHSAHDIFYDLICYFLVLTIMPLGILTYSTFHLIKSLTEAQNKKMSIQVVNYKSREDGTLALIIVIIIYTLCQIPNPSRHIWTLFNPSSKCGYPYYAFAYLSFTFIHINSAVNFLVFFLIGKRFHKKFLSKIQRLLCCFKQNQIAPAPIETVAGSCSTAPSI